MISGLNNIVPEYFVEMMPAWRTGNLPELTRLQRQIGRLMAIYNIGDDFVTTIKTAVARRYDSMSSNSRNYGDALNAEQCAAIDRLFS